MVQKVGFSRVYLAAALLAVGCGGRTVDSQGVPGDGTMPPDDPAAPACTEICRHVVDTCFPGGKTDQCVKDCETTRTEYQGCQWLTPFLKCNLKARVICSKNEATIDDCYSERNDLVRCKS